MHIICASLAHFLHIICSHLHIICAYLRIICTFAHHLHIICTSFTCTSFTCTSFAHCIYAHCMHTYMHTICTSFAHHMHIVCAPCMYTICTPYVICTLWFFRCHLFEVANFTFFFRHLYTKTLKKINFNLTHFVIIDLK